MPDAQKVAELRHVISETPGEFSYWPTHFAGYVPFIEVYRLGIAALKFQVLGITSGSRPSEGDYAIKYARRLAACANEMPGLLDENEALKKENERLRVALKPFAQMAEVLEGREDLHRIAHEVNAKETRSVSLYATDCRKAVAALKEE